jgi:hypothetical protein
MIVARRTEETQSSRPREGLVEVDRNALMIKRRGATGIAVVGVKTRAGADAAWSVCGPQGQGVAHGF